MKKAEKRSVLVRSWTEKRDGRNVYLRRYLLERPVVVEVRTPDSHTYETEYKIAEGNMAGYVVAGVFGAGWNVWEVWAERDGDGMHIRETTIDGCADAERYARKLLREAGYRVRRAKS